MSAQIPDSMLLSDLLKATGYDCPEELQGRTFAEATAGGDVQTNKASTIDVSAYTEPVVITPDTDYESMKKNTVTLNNIPSVKTEEDLSVTENGEYTPEEGKTFGKVTVAVPVGATKLYAWKGANENYVYTARENPEEGDKVISIMTSPGDRLTDVLTVVSVVGTTLTFLNGSMQNTATRDSTRDITL